MSLIFSSKFDIFLSLQISKFQSSESLIKTKLKGSLAQLSPACLLLLLCYFLLIDKFQACFDNVFKIQRRDSLFEVLTQIYFQPITKTNKQSHSPQLCRMLLFVVHLVVIHNNLCTLDNSEKNIINTVVNN